MWRVWSARLLQAHMLVKPAALLQGLYHSYMQLPNVASDIAAASVTVAVWFM